MSTQNDPVAALLAQTSLQNTLFTSTSRYYGLDTGTLNARAGKTIVYVLRRFVPPPENFQLLQEHTVVQGDRLDNLAGPDLVDSTLIRPLFDANPPMRPDDLTATLG